MNKYKANIYADFTILSFHRHTTHNPLKSTATLAPEPTLPKPHYPSKNTITLASLVKGEVLSPEKIRATTGGIALHPHHQLDSPHYPTRFSYCNRLCAYMVLHLHYPTRFSYCNRLCAYIVLHLHYPTRFS